MLLLFAVMLLTPQTLPVRVERSRDTIPTAWTSVSTTLDTNGERAGPQTPVDAERAFAADAKALGQWTAFRKWSTDDAVMFVPQSVNAHEFLKDRKDPPKVIDWWPTVSYVSCTGNVAVNTGGWRRSDGKVGYFSTVWLRTKDGSWKWVVDGGDDLNAARPRPTKPKVIRASCKSAVIDMGGCLSDNERMGCIAASDQSLQAGWMVEKDGSRSFYASIWTGRHWKNVIDDKIAGSPANK